jgi:hypothetical protein
LGHGMIVAQNSGLQNRIPLTGSGRVP